MSMLWTLLLACAPTTTDPAPVGAVPAAEPAPTAVASTPDQEPVTERSLVGQAPEASLEAVSFAGVIGHDGQPRTPDDLLGKPTVLWFYPMAMTPG